MLHTVNIPKRLLPIFSISTATVAVLASRSYAGPLTSSKNAFDAQMTALDGGSGIVTVSAPIFALIVLMIIIFTVITLVMAAFEGGGNLPLAERVKNVLVPAVFITVALGLTGGLVTWIATI